MGLSTFAAIRSAQSGTLRREESLKGLYEAYFPRLFSYVLACQNDDLDEARKLAVECFDLAFRRWPGRSEDSFRMVLFSSAHRLCQPALRRGRPGDPLGGREREVISLTFDAQLSSEEIGRILHASESAVKAALIGGLRKLRDFTSPAALAAYVKPA